MKHLYKILTILIIVSCNIFADESEEEIREKLPIIQSNTNSGKEFLFTIPPATTNDVNDKVKIFITSRLKTSVQVEIKKYNKIINTITKPNEVLEIKLTPIEAQPFIFYSDSMNSQPAQNWQQAGIRITAEDPIVCYIIIKYKNDSEGFLALPVNCLGREYITASYNSWNKNNKFFPPWVGITAAYDNTDVNITMGGTPSSEILTVDGAKIKPGQRVPRQRLQKGDVYMFSSNGPFQDVSGSKIVSSKPVSVVSGHFCANIPNNNDECNYNIEMQMPTETWGKVYHIPAYTPRRYPGIIRIYAKEDNTEIYRDGQFILNLSKGGGIEGEGWVEMRVWPKTQENGQEQRPKNAVISADKPIGITYYNPGTQEDDDFIDSESSSVFTMNILPIEQYQNEVTISTPQTSGKNLFSKNYLNIVYELNTFGFMPDNFEFAELKNGKFEWKAFNDVFGGVGDTFEGEVNEIKYGSKQILLPAKGIYKLRYKTGKFACYSYGFNDYESYGYPTSAALNDLTIPDIWAPKPEYDMTCEGNVTGKVTDMPWPGQDNLRSNLNYIAIDNNTSYNYRFSFNPIEGGTTIMTSWKLDIINPLEDARADLIFIDRAGNDTTITIEYAATKYEITANQNYGQLQLGQSATHKFTIKNLSETIAVVFQDLSLKMNNQGFSIVTPLSWDITKPVEPLGTREVEVKFTADDKLPAGKKFFQDSLGIGHECGKYFFVLLEASTGDPTITVGDHDYGKVNLNIAQPVEKTISIRNDGDATLIITGYSALTNPEFTTNLKTDPMFAHISPTSPLTILPTQAREFKAYFKPTAPITYSDKIIFTANTDVPDPICDLSGEGVDDGMSIVDKQFISIKNVNKNSIELINNKESLNVNKYQIVDILGNTYPYTIENTNNTITLKFNQPLLIGSYILQMSSNSNTQVYKFIINE